MKVQKYVLTGVSDFHHRGNGEMDVWAKTAGDEYHTLQDLYRHRVALSAALFNQWADEQRDWESGPYANQRALIRVWKSLLHSDGTMFDGGYFIVGASTPHGQISYHYDLKDWDLFDVQILDRAPEYDGHTAADVIERLIKNS